MTRGIKTGFKCGIHNCDIEQKVGMEIFQKREQDL